MSSSSKEEKDDENTFRLKQELKTLDKTFEERISLTMRTNADTTNECTNIAVVREDAICMFRRGEISVVDARRRMLKVRMRAARENLMTPSVEAPSGYHQGFVSVRTPYDPVGACYRKWVVLDYEPDGRPVMRICNRRNGSPDEVIRDVICWFNPETCVIPYVNTKVSSDVENVSELSLSIDGLFMSTGTSEVLRNRYQIVMSFCVKNIDVMWQWHRAIVDILPTTLNLAHEGGDVPDSELTDAEIEEAANDLRAKYGRHYEMTKLLNLRTDDDFCASLGMWKPLKMEDLKRKLKTYYSKVCPGRKDVNILVQEAAKTYFNSQQLLHYHLQDKYGASLFDCMPPPIVASHVRAEPPKDEDLLSVEEAFDRPELRPAWNHITDTYGYFLSGTPLKGSRHRKVNKDIVSSSASTSLHHHHGNHHHPLDGAPRRTSMLPWKSSNSNSLLKKKNSTSRAELHKVLSRQSISSVGSEKSLTSSRPPRRSYASSGSVSSTPSSVGHDYEDLIQYEIMIRGSNWTWSGGLPFPNVKKCVDDKAPCKHCRLHKTMIAANYKCYVRISKLDNSPRAETNARAVPQRLEHTSEENLSQNVQFPASLLLELSPNDVHYGMLRFEVCLRNTEGRSHFVMARMEIRASSLLCRPLGSEITMTTRSGTWPGRLYIRILPPLWSSLSACPTTRPMGRSYMIRNPRLDGNVFVREEAMEPHLTYLVPSQFFRLRHEELLRRWAQTKKMWQRKYSKPEDKFDSVWLDKEFRDEYKKTLYEMAMSYADLSARYRLRHVECVPFRSSRQKAKPEWIQGVPVNLHLSLMSTARLRCPTKKEEKEEREERERALSTASSKLTKGIKKIEAFTDTILNRAVLYARTCCSIRAAFFRLVDEFGVQVVNENWKIVDAQLNLSFEYASYVKKGGQKTPSRIKTKRNGNVPEDVRSILMQKYGREYVQREEDTESISLSDLQHDEMKRAKRRIRRYKVDLNRYGQISWGAPTVHNQGYEHGGLSEMYGNEYIKEEKRLKQVQENTFNKKRLMSANLNIKEAQKLLGSFNDVLSQLRSPQKIDEARMNLAKKLAEEKAKNNPDAAKQERPSFFRSIMGGHHETITPAPRTPQEEAEIAKWNRFQSQVQEQKHKLEVLNNVRSSLLKTLNAGVHRARKMLMERDLSILKLSKRRDLAVSMALTALTYGFTFHLEQIADNPSAMKELATVGFLAYFENLLSAADLPGAAHDRSFTQDQICASEALQLVAFKIVKESDVGEEGSHEERRVIKRRATLRAMRSLDQDRKSVNRNKSEIVEMITKEFAPQPPPSASPPSTPDVKLDSISERTEEDSDSPSPMTPTTNKHVKAVVITKKISTDSTESLPMMGDSDSTRPLLAGKKPSLVSMPSHGRKDSVEAEVEGLIDEFTSKDENNDGQAKMNNNNDDDDGDDDKEEKVDEETNMSRPFDEGIPIPPKTMELHECRSTDQLRSQISEEVYKTSLHRLTPPTSLYGNKRFEFPDPKGDPYYTEHELHSYHKRIFWDHGEDVRILRDPVQVRLRLRKSSKYTEGITQNAYIDPTSLRLKRKSSYGTANKFQGLEQYDSSFDNDMILRAGERASASPKNSSVDQKSDTHFSGWLEKMGQKQGLLGGSRFKKRWIVLLNGTLTWYRSDEMTKRKGRLHVEAYKLKEFPRKDLDSALEASFGNKELVKFVNFDGKYFNFELQRDSAGGNLTGVRSVKDVISVEQNEELFEGQLREKLTMRTSDMSTAHEILNSLQRAIKKYKDRSSNYCIRFAGLQLMRPPTNMGTEDVRISTKHETLALEPMRQLVVRVVVPDKLYDRLLPCLKKPDKLIRARPILFTQGISSNLISATQRSLQGTSMLAHRNGINADALVRFEQYVKDLEDLKNVEPKDKNWGDRKLSILQLLQELKVHFERCENKTNPIDGLPALLVASDLVHVLGGLKFVNCMSGKDRTGMSVTLEQSRQLMRSAEFFGSNEYSYSPAGKRDKVRTAQEIATVKIDTPSKHSLTLDIADRMRIAGPRVQICRKSIHKAKFKGSINLFCMKPPKNIAGDVEA